MLDTIQPDSVMSPSNTIAALLQNASDVVFREDTVPHVMAQGVITPVDVPPVSREDIDNFVRNTASRDEIARLNLLSNKSKEEYHFGQRDSLGYSIDTDDYSYRCSYSVSKSGATLAIRKIPRYNKNLSDGVVMSGKLLEE